MKQNNVIVSDTDDDDTEQKERTEMKKKKSRGRPRKERKASNIISDTDSTDSSGEEVEKGGVPGNSKDIISEVPGGTNDIIKVGETVVQSKFLFDANKVINAGMKKSGSKKAEEASSINEQEPEQMEDRNLDKTKPKTKKVKYPCAICEGNVRSNARECKGCYKWVHHRCHIANNGIG